MNEVGNYMLETVSAQTSVPDWLMTYCRQLADVNHNRRLNRMYEFMLESFLKVKPWKANPPLPWRMAKIHGSSGRSRTGADQGWVPMNIVLPVALKERITTAIEVINSDKSDDARVSMRTFLYTAVVWWCKYVYPYNGPGVLPD